MLIGPDGKVTGKDRKVCLPDGEFDNGISPGTDYPVFDTALGKIGMMICYDLRFPFCPLSHTGRLLVRVSHISVMHS